MVACRATLLWLLITGAALGAGRWLLPTATLASGGTPRLEDVLAAVAALALLGCLVWVWVVATVVYGRLAWDGMDPERLLRSAPRGCPAGLTRLLLTGAGVVLVASLAAPSTAMTYSDPVEPTDLSGLPLPDRSTADSPIPDHRPPPAPPQAPAPAPAAPEVSPAPAQPVADARTGADGALVVDGDSLWSIAEERLGPRATPDEVTALWQQIYRTNHDRVGTDPDLIHPGQRLRIPGTTTPTPPGESR